MAISQASREMGAQMGFVRRLAGRVDDQEEAVAQVGDHQVVQDAACLVREKAIALAVRLQPENVDRQESLERAGDIGEIAARARRHRDLAHMGHVEKASGCTRMQMLLEQACRVVQRHLVAGERHHPGAASQMKGV